ncbi:MAG: hypothetical protein ABSH52_32685 [Terriglobia bacterium]|jgi:hypothetical protein
MLTSVMKYVSIMVLVLGFFWNLPVGSQNWPVRNGGYMELHSFLVCLSALLVVAHGFRECKYFWAAGFVAISALLSPVAPVTDSCKMFLGLESVCMMTILVSLAPSRRQPNTPTCSGGYPASGPGAIYG